MLNSGNDTIQGFLDSDTQEIIKTDDWCNAAQVRVAKNLPPKKPKDSGIGDALNWLAVKYYCKENKAEKLHLITSDGDFYHDKDAESPNQLLAQEMKDKDTEVKFYKDINSFNRKIKDRGINIKAPL